MAKIKPYWLSVLLVICCIPYIGIGQTDIEDKRPVKKNPAKKERVLINMNADNWIRTPAYFKPDPYNSRGLDISILYDHILAKSQLSFALGAAFSSHNLYSNAFPVAAIRPNGVLFTKMDTAYFNNTDLIRSKISLNYIDLPFEVRWRSKPTVRTNKRTAVSIGFKFGLLLQSHTKSKGKNDIVVSGVSHGKKYKTYHIQNLNPIRYGVTLRVAHANFYLIGFYGLSTVFRTGKGTPANTLSVGIGYSPI